MTSGQGLRKGLIYGVLFGVALCLWVTVIFTLQGETPFIEVGTTYAHAAASYLIVSAVCGSVIGALFPFAKSTITSYAVGVVAASFVAFGIVVSTYGVPSRWEANAYGFLIVVSLVATLAIGNEINKRRGQ